MTTTLEDRVDALAAFLAIDPDGISSISDQELSADGAEYLVLTDDEANERVKDYIAEIRNLVKKTCGLDTFAAHAISADGRGHFLSPYDGAENEQGDFFIYRIN